MIFVNLLNPSSCFKSKESLAFFISYIEAHDGFYGKHCRGQIFGSMVIPSGKVMTNPEKTYINLHNKFYHILVENCRKILVKYFKKKSVKALHGFSVIFTA